MRAITLPFLMLPFLLGGCVYIDTTPAAPPPQIYYAPPPPPPPPAPPSTQPLNLAPR